MQVTKVSFEQRFHADTLKTLYAYWQDLRRGRTAPSRADLDPAAIESVLPHVVLYAVEEAPRRYRIRLLGSRIIRWYGCDPTARYLDEIDFGEIAADTFAALDSVVDRCLPLHMTGEYTKHDNRTLRFERLYLPLSSNGRRVDNVIGAVAPLAADSPISGIRLDTD